MRCKSSFIASHRHVALTDSLGWRDGEVYPASLVIPQRHGVPQRGFRQMAHPEKSAEGNSSEKMLPKNGVMSEGSL